MPRYIRQRTKSDCGPVAVINVMKWLGCKVSYKNNIKLLKEECKYINDEDFAGVHWWNIRIALNKLGNGLIKARKHDVTDLQVLQDHISQDGAFIFRHRTSPSDFHYSTVVPYQNGNQFLWLNHLANKTSVQISPEKFQHVVKTYEHFGDTPIALLISKI